jgi:BsuBI/PstI restriction endonuclease domain
MLGHRAAPQTAQLGKHEPHPMAAFAAISQFTADPFHKGVLRLNEAVELEWFWHWQFGHCTAPRNDLIRAIIEDFATRLVPGGILIYAGDTGEKWGHFDAPLLAGLGVNVESWQNAGRGVALPGAPLIAAGRVRDQSRPG